MKIVVQRVSKASVTINDDITRSIDHGFVVLLGITHDDTLEDITWLVQKLLKLRVFGDDEGKMNLNIIDTEGSVLLISQFTLYASTRKGNRPSFIQAARPDHAIPLYELFISSLVREGMLVETGEFGADMKVSLVNDGPVTIIIDSKNRV